MIEVELQPRPRDRAWRIAYDRTIVYDRVRHEYHDARCTLRRTLVDTVTGEVLDDVWRDEHGRVRSYSAPRFA